MNLNIILYYSAVFFSPKFLPRFVSFFFVMSRVSGNVFWYQAPYKHWTGQIATALGTWICVQTEWKVVEPINIMILFKCAELEEERSKWLNTKLSVALYTYPQFLATPFLKTGNSPLPSKGAVRIFNPALLFTLCGIRKITTLARDHRPIAHQTRATKVGARHFPSLKILPGRLHR